MCSSPRPTIRSRGSTTCRRRLVAREPFIVREPGSGTRAAMEELPAEHRIELAPAMEMTSNETIKQAVMAGLGVSLLSLHTIGLELQHRLLATPDVEGLPLMRRWHVVADARQAALAGGGGVPLLRARARRGVPGSDVSRGVGGAASTAAPCDQQTSAASSARNGATRIGRAAVGLHHPHINAAAKAARDTIAKVADIRKRLQTIGKLLDFFAVVLTGRGEAIVQAAFELKDGLDAAA